MRIVLLLLVLAAAAGTVAFFLLGDGGGMGAEDEAQRMEEEVFVPPALRGSGVEGQPVSGRRPRGVANEAREHVEDDPAAAATLWAVRVLDATTGQGIAGAVVGFVAPHQEPCPGPRRLDPALAVRTNETGAARLPGVAAAGGRAVSLDLVVAAAGYVPAVLCQPAPGEDVEVRLDKGLGIEGRVRDVAGRAVAGATVFARPGPTTAARPGHFSVLAETTDEKGRFTLGGFLPGALALEIQRAGYMPLDGFPITVPATETIEVTLEPALRLTLRITADDGRMPEHPTLTWIRKEAPTQPNVSLLESLPEASTAEAFVGRPVAVPAQTEALFLEVQGDGYAPWRRTSWKPPAGKSEVTLDVELSSDLSTGTLRATLVDERGDPVNYARASIRPSIQQLSGDAAPGAYVIEQAEDLRVTAMPAGTYRIRLESPSFAPVETDATISPGQETVVTIPVGPPAKLRVRFFGPEEVLVRFRVMNGDTVANGFPEGSVSRGTDEKTGESILTAGRDGITLTGLAAGTHTVEVTSEEVEASPTVVHLTPGETTEVEITVTAR